MNMDYNYMTDDQLRAEIIACKNLLNESDHTIIQTLEGICDCTTATGIINFLKSITATVREKIVERRAWRNTIHECEEELARRDAATQGAE